MRDDFIGELRKHEELAKITDKSLFRVTAPNFEELREIIAQPPAEHGVKYEAELVPRIISQVEGRAGMLPLLQYSLELLWNTERADQSQFPAGAVVDEIMKRAGGLHDRKIDPQTYRDIGGVTGALQQKVAHFYESKTVEQQRAVRNILLALVEIKETESGPTPVSRSASKRQLLETGGTESNRILAELLDEERLLISGEDEQNQDPVIELAHEALIRGWEKLEQWIEQSKEAIQMRNAVTHSATAWEEKRKSGQRREAKDELWRGSKLERAVELNASSEESKQSDFGRIGGLGKLETEFLEACKRGKARQLRRTWMVGAIVIISILSIFAGILAYGQSLLAQDALELAEERGIQSDIAAGEGWLLRARIAASNDNEIESGFYAARAIAFEGFGRTHAASNVLPQPVITEKGSHVGNVLTRLVRGKPPRSRALLLDQYRQFFTLEHAPVKYGLATAMGEAANFAPFLWSSVSQHSDSVLSVAFSPDGQTLASGSVDKSIRLWDVKNGEQKALLNGHSGHVTSVAFSPDSETLVSASGDKTIKLWATKGGRTEAIFRGHSDAVTSVAISGDGETLASASRDETVKLWDVNVGQEIASLTGHSGGVVGVTFSPDGKYLASASVDKTVRLWDVLRRSSNAVFEGHSDVVNSVAFSPDGETLASGSRDKSIRLWDVKSGEQKATLSGHSSSVSSVAFSPDGETLSSGSYDGTVKLWETNSAELRATFNVFAGAVTSVAFSPNGESLVTASSNAITLWKVENGELAETYKGHEGSVFSVIFSPDGQTVASSSSDNSVKLWNVRSGREIATFKPNFSPCFIWFSLNISNLRTV